MIQKDTGWTDDYLLWGVSWANMQLKMADAPCYRYNSKGKEQVIDDDELKNWLNTNM